MTIHFSSSREKACRAFSRRVRRMQGVSLIEVLVSIVIASIGLLALAGVNAASVRYTKMSQYRATATLLANEFAERMRANKAGFTAGNYAFVTDFAGQATVATLPGTLCNTTASSCTSAQIADLDLRQFRILVRNQLPEGSVFLQGQVGVNGMDAWMVWRDPAVASTDEAPASISECPNGLNLAGDLSVRCSFFRINL